MTALVIILLIVNISFLAYFVKKWLDSAPKEPNYPRGGEKPINDFFRTRTPAGAAAAGADDEVREMAEQLLNRIDRKIDLLRDLLRQADQKIDSLSRTSHILPAEMPVPESSLSVNSQDLRNRARTGAGAVPAAPEDDRRARVMQLRRRGMSASQIAQEVGVGRGEVDLILSIEEMNL